MSCYHPIPCYRSRTKGTNGKRGIVFNPTKGYHDLKLHIPCGQCIGCRLSYTRQWAIRICHEASLHPDNIFITLTYRDGCLPLDRSLHKTHFQKFMKRLRKKFPQKKIRYYAVGEYGESCKSCKQPQTDCLCRNGYTPGLGRPHWHAILFNHDFLDKILWQEKSGNKLYRSQTLENLWIDGYSTIATVNYDTAAYVARYTLKKRKGDPEDKKQHYEHLAPELSLMSRRPGIARDWIEKYKSDVYPHDYVVYKKGLKMKPPSYYDKIYDLTNPDEVDLIKRKRNRAAIKRAQDNTPERLQTKELIDHVKINLSKRPIHNL